MFTPSTRASSRATSGGGRCRRRPATSSSGTTASTYVRKPPYFDGMTMELTPGHRHLRRPRARDARRLGHDRPHQPGRQHQGGQPGRSVPRRARRRPQGLQLLRLAPRQPRGHDPRHVREHPPEEPAARRRRGRLHPRLHAGGRPAVVHLRREPELPGRRHAARDLRRQGVRLRLVARLGGQGHEPARRQGGHHRELRAHPPLEPHRHGRRAAAVPGGRELGVARPRRHRDRLDHRPRAAERGRHPQDGPRHRRAERVLRAGQGRRSSSTPSSASTRPARPTTTATAASCSTCCGRSSDAWRRGRVRGPAPSPCMGAGRLGGSVHGAEGDGWRCCHPSPDPAISTP